MTEEEFKANRLTLGLTQTELGEELNIGRRSVQRFESGKWPVSARVEKQLAFLLRHHREQV